MSRMILKASLKGRISVIWDPMWQSMPVNDTTGSFRNSTNNLSAESTSIPNLFSCRPVEMYGCVCNETVFFLVPECFKYEPINYQLFYEAFS